MSSTELVTADSYDFDSAEELAQVWLEESDGDFTPEFPRVKAKGGIFNFGDDIQPSREARGVIVAWHKSSRLYLEDFDDADDAGRRPDAWSTDGKVQVVPPETYEKIERLNAERSSKGLPLLPPPNRNLAEC